MTTITMDMMMTIINLLIKSKDLYNDEIIEKVIAEKKIIKDKICYSYSNDIGKCDLFTSKNKFEMIRKGEANINIFFDKEGYGNFILNAYGLNQNFDIKYGKIEFFEKKIKIFYSIYQLNEIINTLNIEIIEESK